MATTDKPWIDVAATSVQVLAVVAGVVISVLSFNSTREKEAAARQLEAAKPFLELRQKLYLEALKAAAVLVNPETHTADELQAAKKRFRELYVAELSMVETRGVEMQMVALARQIDPDLLKLTPPQSAAYDLAHVLRDSFRAAWSVDQK
jgi:hypothetical protein